MALGGVKAGKLGYAIHADHWGRGCATDAAAALIGFGFTTLGLHRITAAVGPDNQGRPGALDDQLAARHATRRRFPPGRRPRQDSNLRSRLRRAVLYPLSYGGVL